MCYCSTPPKQILSDINRVAVPSAALAEAHCWKTICKVRGANMSKVDPVSWAQLCTERGYKGDRADRY